MNADQQTSTTWILITGEYPPQKGGVSDYTQLVARGLIAAGDRVQVWSSPCCEHSGDSFGIDIYRLPDHFGPRSMLTMRHLFSQLSGPIQIVVQYTPHAYGYKGMNILFCLWLSMWWRNRYWVMCHEVAFPLLKLQSWKHRLLAYVTRFMAARIVGNAGRVFVSIQQWEPALRDLCDSIPPCHWLPVPSNLDCNPEKGRVEIIRRRLVSDSDLILIGHFGTFQPSITPFLDDTLPRILARNPRCVGVLVGRNSNEYAASFIARNPELASRLIATGGLPADEAAHSLAACDLLLQPYPDGACTRRGSLMAGLALGLPIVTTVGRHSDSVILDAGAVIGVPVNEIDGLVTAVEYLVANTDKRQQVGRLARELYTAYCSVDTVVGTMRSYRT